MAFHSAKIESPDAEAERIAEMLAAEAQAEKAAKELLARAAKRGSGAPLPELVYAHFLRDTGEWAKTTRSTDGRVFHWNGVYWEEVDEELCADAAMSWLEERCVDAACDKKAVECWKTARRVLPLLPEVPSRRCILPCADGWLEIVGDQAVRVAPTKTIGITHSIPILLGALPVGARYVPGELPEGLFKTFIELSIQDEGVRGLVQEYAGYTLLPKSFTNLQVALVLVGKGGDGKSVLSNLVTRLHERYCAKSLGALAGFGLEALMGATLAVVDEVPRGVLDDEHIKSLISGDKMEIQRKNKRSVTYAPDARWILCSNFAPRFRSAGGAIRRRFVFAPFSGVPEDRRVDNLEGQIVESELKAVFDWALAGALSLRRRGRFEIPSASLAYGQDAMAKADTVLGWRELADPQHDPRGYMSKNDIYADYVEWCRQQDPDGGSVRPDTQEIFWDKLREHCGWSLEFFNKEMLGPRIRVKAGNGATRALTVRIVIHQEAVVHEEVPPFNKDGQ